MLANFIDGFQKPSQKTCSALYNVISLTFILFFSLKKFHFKYMILRRAVHGHLKRSA